MMPSAGSPETALIPLPPMVPARGGMLPTRDLAAVRIQAGERVRELLEQATSGEYENRLCRRLAAFH